MVTMFVYYLLAFQIFFVIRNPADRNREYWVVRFFLILKSSRRWFIFCKISLKLQWLGIFHTVMVLSLAISAFCSKCIRQCSNKCASATSSSSPRTRMFRIVLNKNLICNKIFLLFKEVLRLFAVRLYSLAEKYTDGVFDSLEFFSVLTR